MINHYVDHIYVINLDHREDRWEECKEELEHIGLEPGDYERFSAVNGHEHPMADEVDIRDGALGCALSHLNLYEDADERGFSKIAVFEDDVIFAETFTTRFEDYFEQLPEDWQFLYLGGNNQGNLTDYSENIKRCTKTWSTHAYLIGKGHRQKISDAVREDGFQQPVDNVFGDLQTEYDFYITDPKITIQREGYSDVVTKHRNYDHVLKNDILNFRDK